MNMGYHDIVLMDGASGTCLWKKAKDKLPVWRYNVENPDIVSELAAEYADAGSRIIMTNTFGANRFAVKRTDYSVRRVVSTAVGLAKDAVTLDPVIYDAVCTMEKKKGIQYDVVITLQVTPHKEHAAYAQTDSCRRM